MEELGADVAPVFNYKNIDPSYVKSILEKSFSKSKGFLSNFKNEKESQGLNFKHEFYNLVSEKAKSGYTRRSGLTLLQAAYHHNFINFEEYKNVLRQLFNEEPDPDFTDSAAKNNEVMMKKQLENSDPFAPLYL